MNGQERKMQNSTNEISDDLFCPKCGCLVCHCAEIAAEKEQQRAREIKRLGGLRPYECFTKERFYNKKLLQRIMARFPKENFFLWGKSGTGKTHAATAVVRDVPYAKVIRVSDISRKLRANGFEQEEETLNAFTTGPLLIDDLCSEKMTDFLQNTLFYIIDKRWNNLVNGLIITSNLSLEMIGEVVGDRTLSRICGLVGRNTIEFSGTDWRLK